MKTMSPPAHPPIASREVWLAQRLALLEKEKEVTRFYDRVSAERRRLPMVRIEKNYVFEGAGGSRNLADLFEGKDQLIVYHFMFDPAWDKGCPGCTGFVDALGDLSLLGERRTSFALISRAPFAKLDAYRKQRGWNRPWYSSSGGDFNYDFHVTLDRRMDSVEYNYRPLPDLGSEESMELPGKSCFLKDGDQIFHTYSMYARGTEMTGGSYYFLDLTALGRQEDWEEPKDRHENPRAGRPDFS